MEIPGLVNVYKKPWKMDENGPCIVDLPGISWDFMVVSWDLMGFDHLVNIQKTMERSTIFNG